MQFAEPDAATARTPTLAPEGAAGPSAASASPPTVPQLVSSLVARVRRAFAVGPELDAARRDFRSADRDRAEEFERLGEAAWTAGVVPAAAEEATSSLREIEPALAALRVRLESAEHALAEHDAVSAPVAEAHATAIADASSALSTASGKRDELRDELRALESEAAAAEAEAVRNDALARSTREEADKLGYTDLSAAARLAREAELARAGRDAQEAARVARTKVAGLREVAAERNDRLAALEREVEAALAARREAEAVAVAHQTAAAEARAALASAVDEVRAAVSTAAHERSAALCHYGAAVAADPIALGRIVPARAGIGELERRCAEAEARLRALEAEDSGLASVRGAAYAAAAAVVFFVALFAALVYSSC
jgi:chromosome segregation ATPase